MTTATSTKEVPPLSELVEAPFREVRDYLPHLNLPGVLIVGSKPLSLDKRAEHEIAALGKVMREKLSTLEKCRDAALRELMNILYPENGMQAQSILDYLGKYRFLTDVAIPRELEDQMRHGFTHDIRRDLTHYRSLLHNGNSGHEWQELKRLQETPTHLTFYHQPYNGREPRLVLVKTKVPQRTAGKIPYDMIEAYRDEVKKGRKGRYKGRLKEIVQGTKFKRFLRLEDGITRDNVGLQFVTLSKEELARIKERIFTSPNIEVLLNKEGNAVEDYYKPDFPYHALHIDVAWNPGAGAKPQFFNPHADVIEVILMELPYFIGANFGLNSYWRRINAQKKGIVRKTFGNGQRDTEPFTEAERQWIDSVRARILRIFNYANSQSQHAYH